LNSLKRNKIIKFRRFDTSAS